MLLAKIQGDLDSGLKARNETVVSTLRLLLSELHNAKIAKGSDLTEEETTNLIIRETKKRRESIEAFEKGNRADLVEKEKAELVVLQGYLPKQLSEKEIAEIVDSVINQLGARSGANIGKVIGQVMAKVKGQADGNLVSNIVRGRLS